MTLKLTLKEDGSEKEKIVILDDGEVDKLAERIVHFIILNRPKPGQPQMPGKK